jgi:hypothetical protein
VKAGTGKPDGRTGLKDFVRGAATHHPLNAAGFCCIVGVGGNHMRERLTSYCVSIKRSWKTSISFAVYGSITFAFTEVIAVNLNSIENYIEDDFSEIIIAIAASLFWFVIITALGVILSVIPAVFCGAILYSFSKSDIQKNNSSTKPSFWRGVGLGAISIIIITLPILLNDWHESQTALHHGPFSIQIIRALGAFIIGSIVGGLAGKRIHTLNVLDNQSPLA